MEDAQGKEIKNLAKTDAVDGENVTLTIDSVVQEKTYNEMKEKLVQVRQLIRKVEKLLLL